jgi:hypothetical protein
MLNPEFYDQSYIVECPICHKRFQTHKPFEGLVRVVEEEMLENECPLAPSADQDAKHNRWPVMP